VEYYFMLSASVGVKYSMYDMYYIILNAVWGPQNFAMIKCVNDVSCGSYQFDHAPFRLKLT